MQFTEQDNEEVRQLRDRANFEIEWERVFKGSRVKCFKCRNTIKASAVRRNLDENIKIPEGKAPLLSFLKKTSYWSLKVAIEAKELANDPKWICHHNKPPEETYFVKAILMGVKELMENDSKVNVKSKSGLRKEQRVRDKTKKNKVCDKTKDN